MRIRLPQWTSLLVAPIFVLLLSAAATAWQEEPRALVIFPENVPGSAREFIEAVGETGGHVPIVYPGVAAIVYGHESRLADLGAWIEERHTTTIEPAAFRSRSEDLRRVVAVWNRSVARRAERALGIESHDHGGDGRCGGGRNVPVDLPDVPAFRDAPDHIPYGAEYYDTSTYLAGTSAVGVWLLESTGGTLDWTTTEETETLQGVQDGLEEWTLDVINGVVISFVVETHTGVPVSDDPISYPQGMESTWIGEALTSAGYNQASAWEKCYAYNNDIRNSYETNWCFSYFICDSDATVNQGLFSTGGYAWAYYGGPWVWMSRYSTWAFNSANYFEAVTQHELGHIYYATDEYDNGAQQWNGYLNVPDNSNPAVICLMNQNTEWSLCGPTKRQVGWRDGNANDVIEPLDPPPSAPLDEYLPDPTPDAILTYTGTANVNTLPNQNPNAEYNPPHDITINTIVAVECRVDGGGWMVAAATDGDFDAYVEAFSWQTPPLSAGVHTIESRAQTSVGIWSDVFGTDTVTVSGTSSAPNVTSPTALRLDPARPNPARTQATIRYALPSAGAVSLEVYAVDGSHVRTLFDGVEDAGEKTLHWDGRTGAGAPVSAGVYWVRLTTETDSRSVKLVWSR